MGQSGSCGRSTIPASLIGVTQISCHRSHARRPSLRWGNSRASVLRIPNIPRAIPRLVDPCPR